MPHILIVEDENATAWALAESLRDDGHAITTVASAEAALEALRRQPADLVITDLRLPGANGLKLARHLRAGRRPVPVIVVTAFGGDDLAAQLAEWGVHEVFPKPFRVDRLRRSVREALGAAAADPRSLGAGGGGP